MEQTLFVPYNIALLAKQHEFDWECVAYYNHHEPRPTPNGKRGLIFPATVFQDHNDETEGDDLICSAPLYQQLLDWFLTKNILIEPIMYTNRKWSIDFCRDITKTHIGSGNFTFFTNLIQITNDFEGFETKYLAIDKAFELAFTYLKS